MHHSHVLVTACRVTQYADTCGYTRASQRVTTGAPRSVVAVVVVTCGVGCTTVITVPVVNCNAASLYTNLESMKSPPGGISYFATKV